MSNINIKFMSDTALANIKANKESVAEKMGECPSDSSWLSDIAGKDIYIEKKYKIKDFKLETSENNDYKEVDLKNSIKLYEHLSCLPMHILTDERFWMWLNLEKFYDVAQQAMPVLGKVSTFRDHYIFSQGARRSIFFGVLSRCYFRVALSVDETLSDKYELTKFVIENPQRFRNLSWRTYSSRKDIVLAVLRAEKDIYEKYGIDNGRVYEELAKYISKIGGTRMLDVISKEDMYEIVYSKLEELISEV